MILKFITVNRVTLGILMQVPDFIWIYNPIPSWNASRVTPEFTNGWVVSSPVWDGKFLNHELSPLLRRRWVILTIRASIYNGNMRLYWLNRKPRILRHIHWEHAFAPPLHLRILEPLCKSLQSHTFHHSCIIILTKVRLLLVLSSSLILTQSNTITEIESVAKRCPKNRAMLRRRLVSYWWIVV